MFCLRCGRETENEQAFCLDCQKVMAAYPVDPNAVVQLPVRKQNALKKTARRRVTPEEQIRVLRKRLRVCAGLLLAAVILIVCLSVPIIRDFGKQKFQIGQNYSTVKPAAESTVVAAEEK